MKKLVAMAMLIGFLSAPVVHAKPSIIIEPEAVGAGAIVAVVGIYLLVKHHNNGKDEKKAEFLSQPAQFKVASKAGARTSETK